MIDRFQRYAQRLVIDTPPQSKDKRAFHELIQPQLTLRGHPAEMKMRRLKIQRRWPQGRRSLSAEDRCATQEAPRRQNRSLTSEQRVDGEELAGGGFKLGEFCRKTELSQASLCLLQPLLAARGKGCPCTGVLSSCQQASAPVSPSTLQSIPIP